MYPIEYKNVKIQLTGHSQPKFSILHLEPDVVHVGHATFLDFLKSFLIFYFIHIK